jgi:hypothetical protein
MVVMGLVGLVSTIGAQAASAEWYDEGVALQKGVNPTFASTATWAWTSSGGGVHCNTSVTHVQLTGGTTDGHVVLTEIEEPKKCEVSGGWAFLCGGTTANKSVIATGTPTLTHNGVTASMSGVSTHWECTNGAKVTLSSVAGQPLVLTPDDTTCIQTFTMTGPLESTLAAGKVQVSASGSILGSDACTFGLVS